MSGWKHFKDKGNESFSGRNYEAALRHYEEAARLSQRQAPREEQAIILSNSVACRLKLKRDLDVARDEAERCIALNEGWSKGYVRLASVLIAMGGHSNEACQHLQTGIRLDPSNQTARTMLVKELRRDNIHNSQSEQQNEDDQGTYGDGRPSAPPMEEDIDDGLTFTQRIHMKWRSMQSWYYASSDNTKALVKFALLMFLILLSFSWGSNSSSNRANYSQTNAYQKFRDGGYDYNHRNVHDRSHGGRGHNSYQSTSRKTYADYNQDYSTHNYGSSNSHNDDYGTHNYGSSNTYNDGYDQYSQYTPPRRSRGYQRSGFSSDYNSTIFITMIIVFVLQALGVPLHHLAPMGMMGMRRGFGFGRGMHFGRGNMGGFNFPMRGNMFQRPRRRWY